MKYLLSVLHLRRRPWAASVLFKKKKKKKKKKNFAGNWVNEAASGYLQIPAILRASSSLRIAPCAGTTCVLGVALQHCVFGYSAGLEILIFNALLVEFLQEVPLVWHLSS